MNIGPGSVAETDGRSLRAGNGSRCEACRMDLDRSALNDIWAAGTDDIVRCTECGAILIRG